MTPSTPSRGPNRRSDHSDLPQPGHTSSDPNADPPEFAETADQTIEAAAEVVPLPPEAQAALFGPNDEYVVVTIRDQVGVFSFDDFTRRGRRARPLTHLRLPVPLRLLAVAPNGATTIYGIDEKEALVVVDFQATRGERLDSAVLRLRMELGVGEPARALHVDRRGPLVQYRPRGLQGRFLYRVDVSRQRVEPIGPVRSDGDLEPLGPGFDDVYLARQHGEIRVVTVPEDRSDSIDRSTIGLERATAVAAIDRRQVVVATKGGYLRKVSLAQAVPLPGEVLFDRICKALCDLLRRCGCGPTKGDCHCPDPGQPDPGKPDPGQPDPGRPTDPEQPGGGPGGGSTPIDDEPCGERQRARLSWTVNHLHRVGSYIVAFAAGHRRMAVLDHNLNVVFEQKLDRRQASASLGRGHTQRMLTRRSSGRIEAWELSDFVATLPGLTPFDPGSLVAPDPAPTTAVFHGQRDQTATPNPTVRICVFTVIEGGQNFGDPDQTKLVDQITPNVFDVVNDYYQEASFGETDINFDVFAHDIGNAGPPLTLPRAIASYFHPDFSPGGLAAVMPGDFADPVRLDGTESLTIKTNPRTGSSQDYAIPLAALWTSHDLGAFPVEVDFDGTETAELTVETQTGDTHVLSLAFGNQTFTLDEGGDEAAFLDGLATHVTDAIRSAEGDLAGSPVTVQDVEFRRIRTSDDDSQFGLIQGRFRIASAGGSATQKGQIAVTSTAPFPAAVDALGLDASADPGVIDSEVAASAFFRHCLRAAQTDMGEGEGANEPYFNNSVSVSHDATAQELTVQINLTSERGGQEADIELVSTGGLVGTGWDVATPVPGSTSTANNQNTLRDSVDLTHDTFTAALDRMRSEGPWDAEAASALFAPYDVMMIGFVGAPPNAVPAGDAWDADNPANFGLLRMFARRVTATDQNNPDPGQDAVQMNTSRVIGQKFSSFSSGVMTHEIGHALRLPDLYFARGYRDDVAYVTPYAIMGGGPYSDFHHFIGWSKWRLGWIPEGPRPGAEPGDRCAHAGRWGADHDRGLAGPG